MLKQESKTKIQFDFFKRNCQKGQGLIETLIFSLALVTAIKLTLAVCWIFMSLLWIEHQLYQGALCIAQQKTKILCKHKVLQKIKLLNPLGKIQGLSFTKNQNTYKGELLWSFYRQNFLIRQSLTLPQ